MICYQGGVKICCDGEGCEKTADFPITKAPVLSQSEQSPMGWLFVRKGDEHQHYCPDCMAKYLQDR